VELANAGTPVLGVCGGLQMLGTRIDDPAGVDGARRGLALLAVETVFQEAKRTENVVVSFDTVDGPFASLSGLSVPGYEIRHGDTRPVGGNVAAEMTVFQEGNVLGVTAHGVLGDTAVLRALFGATPQIGLDAVFDKLADLAEERFDVPALLRVAGLDA
jgi:adenosylcobyric acid synthase